jgi:hypothetical protein
MAILQDYHGFLQADAANVRRHHCPAITGSRAGARVGTSTGGAAMRRSAGDCPHRAFYAIERRGPQPRTATRTDAADAVRRRFRQTNVAEAARSRPGWKNKRRSSCRKPDGQAIAYAKAMACAATIHRARFLNIDNNASSGRCEPWRSAANYLAGSDAGGQTAAVVR